MKEFANKHSQKSLKDTNSQISTKGNRERHEKAHWIFIFIAVLMHITDPLGPVLMHQEIQEEQCCQCLGSNTKAVNFC